MEAVDFIMGMTPHDLVSAIAQLLLAIGVVGNMLLSWRNGRKIKEVHDATNGMKDELISTTQIAGEAKGRLDEQAERRVRDNEGKN